MPSFILASNNKLVINGDFRIHRRGNANVTLTTRHARGFVADRWHAHAYGAKNLFASRVALPGSGLPQ